MTPESVRREILLLASGAWAGPWQVLLRVRELDPTLSEAEVETMVQVALEGLAQRGCLWFLRRNPAGVHVASHSMLSSSEVHAALSDSGWRVAPPLDDLSFGLTSLGERALAQLQSRRERKELAKVVAGVAAAVRGLIRRRSMPSPAGRLKQHRSRGHGEIGWGYGSPIASSLPFVGDGDNDLDDDAGLAAAGVPRRPPDLSGSSAAAAIPEPDFEFELDVPRVA